MREFLCHCFLYHPSTWTIYLANNNLPILATVDNKKVKYLLDYLHDCHDSFFIRTIRKLCSTQPINKCIKQLLIMYYAMDRWLSNYNDKIVNVLKSDYFSRLWMTLSIACIAEGNKCPTPGCNGQGHVTGLYSHHRRYEKYFFLISLKCSYFSRKKVLWVFTNSYIYFLQQFVRLSQEGQSHSWKWVYQKLSLSSTSTRNHLCFAL